MNTNTTSFRCSWSIGVIIITAITVILLIVSLYIFYEKDFPFSMLWLKYMLIIILAVTIIGGLCYMPIRLTIKEDTVTLHKLSGSINVPIKDIIELKTIPGSEIRSSIRIFGSGGMFGFLGKFRNPRLGRYTMYATNLNELILIRTSSKKYIFSCSHHKEFVELIQKSRKQLK